MMAGDHVFMDTAAILARYKDRSDKYWSLVDCISMIICDERKIYRVFTTDRNFQQAGFEILLQR
jgi:predicted nucleic acid-binding protein